MILVFKKFVCIAIALVICFSFSAFATEKFYVYGEDDIEHFCEMFNMDACEISSYFKENNITYFACNQDNSKQIKRAEIADAFSQKAVDLSVFEDEEILELADEISGFENVNGSVVKQADYKFLKLEMKSNDSGGDYVLTQYTTVKEAKRIVLAFYTTGDADRGYIDDFFAEQFKEQTDYKPFVIIGVAVFGFIGLVALAFVIKDFKKEKE